MEGDWAGLEVEGVGNMVAPTWAGPEVEGVENWVAPT